MTRPPEFKPFGRYAFTGLCWTAFGVLLPLAIWWAVKNILGVSDRYLPSFTAVIRAHNDIEPSIWVHLVATGARTITGMTAGVILGVYVAVLMLKHRVLDRLLLPIVQGSRATPGVALVPFFILWFGFSEVGKFLIIVSGITANIVVAALAIGRDIPDRYVVFFTTFGLERTRFHQSFIIRHILQHLLPTVRTSLTLAIGLVVVAELLGSQVGLGYLLQTSRSTFSLHVTVLAVVFIGLLNGFLDLALARIWGRLIFWRE